MRRDLLCVLAVLLPGVGVAHGANPDMTNVQAGQVPGTGQVRISYKVSWTDGDPGTADEVAIEVEISRDGGATYGIVPIAVSGDIGRIPAGPETKVIFWEAAQDLGLVVGDQYRAKVIATGVMPWTADLLVGDATMEFMPVASGTFTMGSANTEQDRFGTVQDEFSNEGPQHEVTITREFSLGRYEVTQGQWYAVMHSKPWSGKAGVVEDVNRPAVYVSWYDAQAFIAQLNQAANQAALYRLPTEAEWEYACRAGTTTPWSFGDDANRLGDYAWYGANTGWVSQPVGTKPPNPWGLHDMHGNVNEWCQDRLGPYPPSAQVDPMGPVAGQARLLRGGGCTDYLPYTRSAYRAYLLPSGSTSSYGFRVLRGGVAGTSMPQAEKASDVFSLDLVDLRPKPRLLSVAPSRNQISVAPTANVVATFAAPMDAPTPATFAVHRSFSPTQGAWSGGGTETLTFDPAEDLKPGEKVEVTLARGLTTTAGRPLVPPEVWQFTGATAREAARFSGSSFISFGSVRSGVLTYAVALGDVDGDGDLDLAAGNHGSPAGAQSYIYLNDGHGLCAGTRPVGPGDAWTRALAFGDGDGDGDLDLAVGTYYENTVYLNDGSGVFDAGAQAFGTNAREMAFADLDGDGDLDLAAAGSRLTVHVNNGTGRYEEQRECYVGMSELVFAVGDMDSNGNLDIVLGHRGGLSQDPAAVPSAILYNDGTGRIGRTLIFSTGGAGAVALGDVNGDGDLDIALGGFHRTPSQVYVNDLEIPNDGAGRFAPTGAFRPGSYANRYVPAMGFGDLDGDGDLDLAMAVGQAEYDAIYLNDGSSSLTDARSFIGGFLLPGIALGDVDGNGTLDLASAGNGNINVHLNAAVNPRPLTVWPDKNQISAPRDATVQARFAVPMVDPSPATFAVHRFLAPTRGAYGQGGAGVLYFHPTDDFRPGEKVQVTLTQGLTSTGGVALDPPEVWEFTAATASEPADFSSASFKPLDPRRASQEAWNTNAIALADVDGDGDLDWAVGDFGFLPDMSNFVYLNGGDGSFTERSEVGSGHQHTEALAFGDVDGDGDLDLAVASDYHVELDSVYLNDGQGHFDAGTRSFGTPYDISPSVAFGDLNGDGHLDIVATNAVSRYPPRPGPRPNYVYLNDGSGHFGDPREYYAAVSPLCPVAVGDLDNDGDLDIVAGDGGGVVFNDGTARFALPDTVGGAGSPAMALGDVDGDGDLDLSLGSSLYINDGTGHFPTSNIVPSTNDHSAARAAFGDLDGDGDLDLARTNGPRETDIFLNDGTGGFAPYRSVGSDNWFTTSIALGDVDANGTLDLAVATSFTGGPNRVYLNHGMCGRTIRESIVLTEDVTGCGGPGLIVDADDITIDGNGHRISGAGADYGGAGIQVGEQRARVTIQNLTIDGFRVGIAVSGGQGVRIAGNTLSDNQIGIQVDGEVDAWIGGNTLRNNEVGVLLSSDTQAAQVLGNTIRSNGTGILAESSGHLIYHNILWANAAHVQDAGGNTWWHPTAHTGNYWSNYWGDDDGSDGRVAGDLIGDTGLPHEGVDWYPLLDPSLVQGEAGALGWANPSPLPWALARAWDVTTRALRAVFCVQPAEARWDRDTVWLVWRGGGLPAGVRVVGPEGKVLSADVNGFNEDGFYLQEEPSESGPRRVHALIAAPANAGGVYSLGMTAEADLTYWMDHLVSQAGTVALRQSLSDVPLRRGETRALDTRLSVADGMLVARRVVDIDIQPGDETNAINQDGHGVIPVAILGRADFDVAQVDPATVRLEGLKVKAVGKKNKLLAHTEDVNDDGYNDLVMQIEDTERVFDKGAETATLTGNLKVEFGGNAFEGYDGVRIVPRGAAKPMSDVPVEFTLEPNYPNPANPIAQIAYGLAEASDVSLVVYNILGQPIRTLVRGTQSAGYYQVTWDGRDDRGHEVSSGVYLYRFVSKGLVQTNRMLLLK